jgi:hypothetical protein
VGKLAHIVGACCSELAGLERGHCRFMRERGGGNSYVTKGGKYYNLYELLYTFFVTFFCFSYNIYTAESIL